MAFPSTGQCLASGSKGYTTNTTASYINAINSFIDLWFYERVNGNMRQINYLTGLSNSDGYVAIYTLIEIRTRNWIYYLNLELFMDTFSNWLSLRQPVLDVVWVAIRKELLFLCAIIRRDFFITYRFTYLVHHVQDAHLVAVLHILVYVVPTKFLSFLKMLTIKMCRTVGVDCRCRILKKIFYCFIALSSKK